MLPSSSESAGAAEPAKPDANLPGFASAKPLAADPKDEAAKKLLKAQSNEAVAMLNPQRARKLWLLFDRIDRAE